MVNIETVIKAAEFNGIKVLKGNEGGFINDSSREVKKDITEELIKDMFGDDYY